MWIIGRYYTNTLEFVFTVKKKKHLEAYHKNSQNSISFS